MQYSFEYETVGGRNIPVIAEVAILTESRCVGCDLPCRQCGSYSFIDSADFVIESEGRKQLPVNPKSKQFTALMAQLNDREDKVIAHYERQGAWI